MTRIAVVAVLLACVPAMAGWQMTVTREPDTPIGSRSPDEYETEGNATFHGSWGIGPGAVAGASTSAEVTGVGLCHSIVHGRSGRSTYHVTWVGEQEGPPEPAQVEHVSGAYGTAQASYTDAQWADVWTRVHGYADHPYTGPLASITPQALCRYEPQRPIDAPPLSAQDPSENPPREYHARPDPVVQYVYPPGADLRCSAGFGGLNGAESYVKLQAGLEATLHGDASSSTNSEALMRLLQ